MASLYIHIPFCARKCAYCDFPSWASREAAFPRYLSALEGEIQAAAKEYGKMAVRTVYIGGGTPSLAPSDMIVHLLAMSRAFFSISPDAEITVECNPGTLTLEKLRDYAAAGVNRLSIGMQSASDRLLHLLGRIHTHEQTEEAVALAKAAGFRNINLDLMYALPTQTMAEWVDTVKEAMRLDTPHLSLYSLILEPGTAMTEAVARGEYAPADEETTLAMQHAAARMLARRGLSRYEISNYAKPGFECAHNLVYWRRGAYLGIGCAAHSLMREERFANTASLDDYLNGVRCVSRSKIDAQGQFEEAVMLGTRTREGVPLDLLRKRMDTVKRLREGGLVETKAGRLTLTERGMDVQNAVVLALTS